MCAKASKKAVKNPPTKRRMSARLNKSQTQSQVMEIPRTRYRKPLGIINSENSQCKTVISNLKSASRGKRGSNQSNQSSSVQSNDKNESNPRARHGEISFDVLATERVKRTRPIKSKNIAAQENRASSANSSALTDYLGMPTSDEHSHLYVNSEASSTRQSSRLSTRQTTRKTTRLTTSTATVQRLTIGRKQQRKQAKPKKGNRTKIRDEIRKYQNSTNLLIPRLPFQRLVREIMQQFKINFRVQSASLDCLQEACECYLVQLFEDSYISCLHRSRRTLSSKDLRFIQILRGPLDAGRR